MAKRWQRISGIWINTIFMSAAEGVENNDTPGDGPYLTLGLTSEVMLLPFCPFHSSEIKSLIGILREEQHKKSYVARNCQYVKYC